MTGDGRGEIHYRKKVVKPCDKRAIVERIRTERPKDICKACRILNISVFILFMAFT